MVFSSQGERTFSEEEEQKLQAALSLDKQALNLVLETAAFILEQVSCAHLTSLVKIIISDLHFLLFRVGKVVVLPVCVRNICSQRIHNQCICQK